MEIESIYCPESEQNNDIVFRLSSGYLLVKRSRDKVKKFDIDRWEEISYIPEDYREIDREPTEKEIKSIKQFLRKERKNASAQNALWVKLKAIWQKLRSIIPNK